LEAGHQAALPETPAKKEEPGKKEPEKEARKVEIPEGCVSIDEFFRCKLRVAKVLSCEAVRKSEKLLKFELDLGTERRTILSGIHKFYEPEQLIGRNLVIIANLPPRRMMGIESNGMILSAVEEREDGSETLRVLTVDGDIAPGSEVG
ncbi:MAG: methionine--tRNA ligase subunit beta, partial [Clostridia bacterium]|nr:methionine--tRNA ligase subunit beta [Clostridia bacterium]